MFTPRRTIHRNVRLSRRRALPIKGKVHVAIGDKVSAEDIVLSAELNGDIGIIRLDQRLGVAPEEISRHVVIKEGDYISQGDIIYSKKGWLGFGEEVVESPMSGTVEFIESHSGRVGIRENSRQIEVPSFIQGTVSESSNSREVSISSQCSLLQGVYGVGEEAQAIFHDLDLSNDAVITPAVLSQKDYSGAIIGGGKTITPESYKKAAELGVLGIVTASINPECVHTCFTSFSAPQKKESDPILLIVEGVGDISLSDTAKNFFKFSNGKQVSLSGKTQVRAGAIRPELIVHEFDPSQEAIEETYASQVSIGDNVRVARGLYQGSLAEVVSLPDQAEEISSGIKALVAELKINDELVKVARANLELI